MNQPLPDQSNFTVRQPLFPADRPDITPSQTPPVAAPTSNMSAGQMIDMDVIGMVMGRYELSKQWRRERRLIWDKCWQNMKGVYDRTGKLQWQAGTFLHLTSKVVEVISANLFGALFSTETPIEWQTKRSDYDPEVRCINDLIQTDLEKTNFKPEGSDFVRNLCVMGTAIGEVGYVKQMETVMVKNRQPQSPVDDMLRSMGMNQSDPFVPKQMLVKDFATIKNKDIYDIYPEPRVPEFTKDHWVIEKTTITNRELKMGSMDTDPYYRFDNITDDVLERSASNRIEQDPELQTKRYAMLDYNLYTHHLDPDREHDLYKYYGLMPIWYVPGMEHLRNDRKRQYDAIPGCIWVVDGQHVISRRISPWRDGEPPYFKGNYIRLPGEFYGMGVAELVMGLQVEKNEIRNSRMDNINLSMNKIIAVLKDKVPPGEWNRLRSEPGAIWVFKGVEKVADAIQQVEMGDVTRDSWLASKEVDQEAQETSGAVKATLGVQGGADDAGGNTFRGQMLNAQAASERWMLYARILETMGLVPAIKKFYQRIYQFKEYKDAVLTLGPDRAQQFQFIAPEDLDRIAKLVPLGVMTAETKGVRLAQMAQFVQQMSAMAGPLPPWFKALEYARKNYVEMGNPEPDSVLFSDSEMQQYTQMKQMGIQEQMNQGPGGMPPGGPHGPPGGPQGLLGPNGQPMPPSGPPQTGQAGNSPMGMPVSGNVPGPSHGMPRPAMPARGPGASGIDLTGRPAA